MKSSAPPNQELVALCRRLLKAAKRLGAHEASEEAVHKFRVCARRLAMYSRLAAKLENHAQWQRLARKLGEARRRLGPVRDLDVHRKAWQELSDNKACGPILREYFVGQRELFLKKVQKKSDPLRLAEQLLSVSKKIRALDLKSPSISQARKRFAKVFRAQERFEKKRRLADLHRVRIQVKKLRYSLDPLTKQIGPGSAVFIRRLKAVQEQLGQVHDFETLAGELRRVLGVGQVSIEASAEVEALIERLKKNIASGVELWRSSWPRHRRAFQSFLKKIKVQA